MRIDFGSRQLRMPSVNFHPNAQNASFKSVLAFSLRLFPAAKMLRVY